MKKLIVQIFGLLLTAVLITPVLFVPKSGFSVSETSTVGLKGRVLANAPSRAPEILTPKDGEIITGESITIISGTCQSGLVVEVYINERFSGSDICESEEFSIEVNLYDGENRIFARSVDGIDQASPDSLTVIVHVNGISNDLRLSSAHSRKSVDPNNRLTWPLVISGGEAPYAVYVEWGDGGYGLKSIAKAGEFSVEHSFRESGIYKIFVRAQDVSNNRAVLQLVAISNGRVSIVNNTNCTPKKNKIAWWVALILLGPILLNFWLGRRYERRLGGG